MGRVVGSYAHGLLAHDAARAALLRGWGVVPCGHRHDAAIDAALDALAVHLERHVDVERLIETAR